MEVFRHQECSSSLRALCSVVFQRFPQLLDTWQKFLLKSSSKRWALADSESTKAFISSRKFSLIYSPPVTPHFSSVRSSVRRLGFSMWTPTAGAWWPAAHAAFVLRRLPQLPRLGPSPTAARPVPRITAPHALGDFPTPPSPPVPRGIPGPALPCLLSS